MLKFRTYLIAFGMLGSMTLSAQPDALSRFDPFLGEWTGSGEGFGNNRSSIHTELKRVMDGKYIEFTNESWFDPTNGGNITWTMDSSATTGTGRGWCTDNLTLKDM